MAALQLKKLQMNIYGYPIYPSLSSRFPLPTHQSLDSTAHIVSKDP